jgi:hypothetical protein
MMVLVIFLFEKHGFMVNAVDRKQEFIQSLTDGRQIHQFNRIMNGFRNIGVKQF